MPVDPFLVVAVVFMLAGVAGVVLPLLPGPALSVVGVLLYWWSTGYAAPALPVVVALVAVGVVAVGVELFAEFVGARAGGASTLSSVLGVLVGLVSLVVLGPLGMLAGIAATIAVVEVYRGATLREGVRAATVAVAAALASGVVQALLAVAMLVGFLVAVL